MTITETPPQQPSTANSTPPPPPRTRNRAPVVVAVVLTVIGVMVMSAGGALSWLATKQDNAGFLHTDTGSLHTNGFAMTSDRNDLALEEDLPGVFDDAITFRI